MAAIRVRNLDEWVVERIRARAAEHGHSMEAEVRSILVDAAREPGAKCGLSDQIHALFEGIGDDFEIPERGKDLPRATEFGLRLSSTPASSPR